MLLQDIPPVVTIDGDFLPDHPLAMLSRGDFKGNVSVLISSVDDEGASFLSRVNGIFRTSHPDSLTLQQAKSFLYDFLTNHILKQPVPREVIEKVYFSGLDSELDDENAFRRRITAAYGDLYVTCPLLELTKSLLRHSETGQVRAYQWLYRAKLGKEKLLCAKWAGTCHSDDVYPAFGLPFANLSLYTNRERDISREVMAIIGTFSRTG